MRRLLVTILLCCSLQAYAKSTDAILDQIYTPLQLGLLFEEKDITGLPDLVDREEKIASCMREYIKKQSKSYAKTAQETLFSLMHDFDNIVSRIYGKKGLPDSITYEEKVELLARVQCEAYYKMGILK